MFKDKRVKQAEEILKVLEDEPPKISSLVGGFVTILVGIKVLDEVTKKLNE